MKINQKENKNEKEKLSSSSLILTPIRTWFVIALIACAHNILEYLKYLSQAPLLE